MKFFRTSLQTVVLLVSELWCNILTTPGIPVTKTNYIIVTPRSFHLARDLLHNYLDLWKNLRETFLPILSEHHKCMCACLRGQVWQKCPICSVCYLANWIEDCAWLSMASEHVCIRIYLNVYIYRCWSIEFDVEMMDHPSMCCMYLLLSVCRYTPPHLRCGLIPGTFFQ